MGPGGPLLSPSRGFLLCKTGWHSNRLLGDCGPHTPVFTALSFIAVGMAAPSMKERQVCWGARDEYWKCLDENLEDASQCKKLRSSFESSCPQQWIKYFDKRRDYLKFKEKFEAGQFEPSETTAKS
ncbi:cytochrome c oxidase assembly factor 6 homolog isoform X2 [Pan paniscus]|uniref:Cytochrome c oxidase assembly factor 6 homolog n=1 Tax=Pan paniscus TaxID=9597 RepID=A0A2R9BV20_PANPA|nr:cytochrome c oxidase assembly factor 6 homolog isoform X2 [Pan paniscus]